MSSQIFRARLFLIKLTTSLVPSNVGKSLPAQFLEYFVNVSSTKGTLFDQERPGAHIINLIMPMPFLALVAAFLIIVNSA